jgi:hypothetical protein
MLEIGNPRFYRCFIPVAAVCVTLLSVVAVNFMRSKAIDHNYAVVQDCFSVLEACKGIVVGTPNPQKSDTANAAASLGNVFEIKGDCLVWDLALNDFSGAHWKLPKNKQVGMFTMSPRVTVFVLLEDTRKELDGVYDLTGEKGFSEFRQVCIIYWPELQPVGTAWVHTFSPPDEKLVVADAKLEISDRDSRIANWIESHGIAGSYITTPPIDSTSTASGPKTTAVIGMATSREAARASLSFLNFMFTEGRAVEGKPQLLGETESLGCSWLVSLAGPTDNLSSVKLSVSMSDGIQVLPGPSLNHVSSFISAFAPWAVTTVQDTIVKNTQEPITEVTTSSSDESTKVTVKKIRAADGVFISILVDLN